VRVGVDIGGTFTDVVLFDEERGTTGQAKALTTPAQLASGVRDALRQAKVPLSQTELLIHGTTVVVNAIIERTGARTALITTAGFRDVYEIGRINRPESFNPRFRKHRPLIPREMIFEVPERMLADGTERQPLDEAAALALADILREEKVEAAAILFLHAYRWPAHERRMADLLKERLPGVFISASHELSREYREYERTSTVVANAYVGPRVSTYLGELEQELQADGFGGHLLVMQSNGGLADPAVARRQCIQLMESGPAGGVVGAMSLAETLGIDDAVAFDMGGTTAKACVIRRGEPGLSPDYFIGGYNEGLAIRIPVLDIVEVGTGGGSIAWLDDGGALHVGPRSAGAEPGPACYGRGGHEPTITDANVVLGRLDPGQFLGGNMQLDRLAAERTLRERIASPLQVDLRRAASGMLEIATTAMANAVRGVTLQRGLDPRDFTLLAYGGGGPLHAVAVARELSIHTVVIPRTPGHFSALGMLLADLRRDYVQTVFTQLAEQDMAALEEAFRALESTGRAALERSGMATRQVVFERAADMRYRGQEHAVAVRLPARLGQEEDRAEIKRLFDIAHQVRYGHSAPDEPADIVSLRLSAIGRLNKPAVPQISEGGCVPPEAARQGPRTVWAAHGELTVEVFKRDLLLAGNQIVGPAIVEEAASTTLLDPGDSLTVNRHGHLIIHVGDAV